MDPDPGPPAPGAPSGPASGERPSRSSGLASLAISIAALAVFVAMWVGFAYALVADPGLLDEAWDRLVALSAPVAVVAWVLFLPIAVGLWIWHSSWPPVVGFLLAAGMVAWTLAALSATVRALRVVLRR